MDALLTPVLMEFRDRIAGTLDVLNRNHSHCELAKAERHDFAILNAAIARRIPVQGES